MSLWSVAEKMFPLKKIKEDKYQKESVLNSLLIETPDINPGNAGPVLSKYSVIIHDITMSCTVLSEARSSNQLIDIIGNEVSKYPLKNLTKMMADFSEKVKDIDESYGRKVLKIIHDQIFETRHQIIMLREKREYSNFLSAPGKKSQEYWLMVLEACRVKASVDDPSQIYIKYLLAGFRMFVLKEPAHPVGTPFPGGHEVEHYNGKYYCPVKDKADDIPYALCHFCPAEQSSQFILSYTKKQRDKKKKSASMQDTSQVLSDKKE